MNTNLIAEFAKASRTVEKYQNRKPKTKTAKEKANAINAKSWEIYDALVAAGLDEQDLSDAAMYFDMCQNADREGATLEF